jgi:diguanylate cyclase (GGDEF)-like protein
MSSMLARIAQSRVVARAAIAVLAIGVFVLAGLALWSTSTTQRATARVAAANELGDAWGRLFDHVNLEEDMMHAYVGTQDEAQRHSFSQTIGGAEPILASLRDMGDTHDRLMAQQAVDAYRSLTATLKNVLAAGREPATLDTAQQRGQFAAAGVRQLVSASMASERQETRVFNQGVDEESQGVRVATTLAFSICIGLLLLCSAVLLGYQRRVERQAASNRHDALHDALTGLANRTLLADRTDAAMRTAERHGEPVGLLLIDLDGFKQVNDTLGHQFGDLLLQQVAARLLATVRECDTVARVGGDEFAVLLPRLSSPEGAMEIARRVLYALQQPVELDHCVLEVGGSIGIAVYPAHCDDAEQLLQYADIAMYTAKRGRLGAVEYDPAQNAESPQQLTLLAELRRALDTDEIVPHYQPKIDTETGRVCGVEVLARWQHPQRGLVGPLDFIPLAEQGGLIDQLTHQVLAEALDQCRRWREEGLYLPVAVNVSARCLLNPDFADTVADLLLGSEVPADMLTLEITESAVIGNPAQALELLRQIRGLGVRLSIDDFGTGYSSMAYLQEMPINELKIDRCFVSRMNTEANNKAIVRAVLDLARNLGLQVVAEGVEDQETFDELNALGCHVSQGYLFSRPLPPAELAACVAKLGVVGARVPEAGEEADGSVPEADGRVPEADGRVPESVSGLR